MGKAKKRSLHLGINDMFENISRSDAMIHVLKAFKHKNVDNEIINLISLFGFTSEELLENGADYEDVVRLKPLVK